MQNHFPTPLFFDGAFGTYYFSVTGDTAPCERACLTAPETVLSIHREYLAAGARAIITNTFAANPQTMDRTDLEKVLEAGLFLARRAAADYPGARVFADIGGITGDTAESDYRQTAEIFLSLGAESFLFETLAELDPLLPTLEWLRKTVPGVTIFVSFAVAADGYSRRGHYYRTLLEACGRCDAIDAAGLNCLCGPNHMLALLQKLPAMPKPLMAMANAGYPQTLNGRLYFEDNAGYFAEKVAGMYAAGVDILGGCCGTTPRHIALAARALEHAPDPVPRPVAAPWTAKVPVAHRPGHKLIAVELDPPQTPDCGWILEAASQLTRLGVDWITVADSPLARARADSIMISAKIRRETGACVLPHLSCRDRSVIGIKAALLGASMEGIRDVLVVTGDAPAHGGVFEFHAASLMRYLSELNSELFTKNPIRMAGALNLNARNFQMELERAKRKLDNGATMLLTQPVFSEAALANLYAARKKLDCLLLAGILPVAGYKNALFLSNEVTGIVIPSDLLEKFRTSPPEEVQTLSVEFAAGIARRCYDACDGYYIMTPLRKTDIVCGLLERIRDFDHKGDCP